jgi:hypothetical protein
MQPALAEPPIWSTGRLGLIVTGTVPDPDIMHAYEAELPCQASAL